MLKELLQRLNIKFGKEVSVDNLENMRKFYLTYGNIMSGTAFQNDECKKSETLSRISDRKAVQEHTFFALSWSHYIFLMRIEKTVRCCPF